MTGSWKAHVASEMRGKKFASRAEANAFMKKLSSDWKSGKGIQEDITTAKAYISKLGGGDIHSFLKDYVGKHLADTKGSTKGMGWHFAHRAIKALKKHHGMPDGPIPRPLVDKIKTHITGSITPELLKSGSGADEFQPLPKGLTTGGKVRRSKKMAVDDGSEISESDEEQGGRIRHRRHHHHSGGSTSLLLSRGLGDGAHLSVLPH